MNMRSLLILVFLLFAVSCSNNISESKAKQIATVRLYEYCTQENIKYDLFGAPKISSEAGYPWIFDYESNTNPRHLVRIYVDKKGKIDINRMIEDATNIGDTLQIKYVYEPPRTFCLNEKIKGIKMAQLEDTLREYCKSSSSCIGVFKSEYKLTPKEVENIQRILNNAGIKVIHFWVPVNLTLNKSRFVDEIKQTR